MIDDDEVAANVENVVCIDLLIDVAIGIERHRFHEYFNAQRPLATHYPFQCPLCNTVLGFWRVHVVNVVVYVAQYWYPNFLVKFLKFSFESVSALYVGFRTEEGVQLQLNPSEPILDVSKMYVRAFIFALTFLELVGSMCRSSDPEDPMHCTEPDAAYFVSSRC